MEYIFVKRTQHLFKGGAGPFSKETIEQLDPSYITDGRAVPVGSKPEPEVPKPVEPIKDPVIQDKLEEIIEDLKDDGKLNHSNNPKKKSPGRPKKKKGFFSRKK